MALRNEIHEIAIDTAKQILGDFPGLRPANVVPFGQEKVRKSVEADRFLAMTPQQRNEFVDQHGPEYTLDVVRRGMKQRQEKNNAT